MTPCRRCLSTPYAAALAVAAIGSVPRPAPAADNPLILDLGNGVKMELLAVPAGEFLMGSPESEKDRDYGDRERQHRQKIPRPFYMGKFEITQKQWHAVMGNNPSRPTGDDLPVTRVSWHAAQKYCEKLSASLGKNVRLPWEAEWEYACRAGTSTTFSFGDTDADLARHGWFFTNSDLKLHPVGKLAPNPWGFHDMYGNVQEWCRDYLMDYRPGESTSPQTPTNDPENDTRVMRGGKLGSYAKDCRSAARAYGRADDMEEQFGFRIVVDNEPYQAPAAKKAFAVAPPTNEKPLVLDLGGGVSMELIAIPSGEFRMGCWVDKKNSRTEPGADTGMERQHTRKIAKSFYLGRTEVTQKQWLAVMAENPSKHKGDTLPIEFVSWEKARQFCEKLSQKTGRKVRLPWESEWEYACRAGTTTVYYFGDDPKELKEYGWYSAAPGDTPHPVATLKPNPWGLYDMHGNVHEWCQDLWLSYEKSDVIANVEGRDLNADERSMRTQAYKTRAARGGAYDTTPNVCRCANRYHGSNDPFSETSAGAPFGLRVVVEKP